MADEDFVVLKNSAAFAKSDPILKKDDIVLEGKSAVPEIDTLPESGEIASVSDVTALKSDVREGNAVLENGKRRIWRSIRTIVSQKKGSSP